MLLVFRRQRLCQGMIAHRPQHRQPSGLLPHQARLYQSLRRITNRLWQQLVDAVGLPALRQPAECGVEAPGDLVEARRGQGEIERDGERRLGLRRLAARAALVGPLLPGGAQAALARHLRGEQLDGQRYAVQPGQRRLQEVGLVRGLWGMGQQQRASVGRRQRRHLQGEFPGGAQGRLAAAHGGDQEHARDRAQACDDALHGLLGPLPGHLQIIQDQQDEVFLEQRLQIVPAVGARRQRHGGPQRAQQGVSVGRLVECDEGPAIREPLHDLGMACGLQRQRGLADAGWPVQDDGVGRLMEQSLHDLASGLAAAEAARWR